MRISDWSSDVCSSDLEFPILGTESMIAAKVSLAALRQGGYEAFHKTMMGLRGRLSEAAIWQAAAEAGLDVARLRRDIDRKSVGEGKRVSVRVDLGGRRIIKKKNTIQKIN